MAIISPSSFDPLKRYVAVRLQQGVPLVDADWNELEDVRRFELRAYLKWFVGDGVPEGSDGFRCEGTGAVDDFTIRRGVGAAPGGATNVDIGLRHVGRCIVDGLDVIIAADTTFRAQPLHTSVPGAAALAAQLGVPVVPELPSLDGSVLVYLDVWERLVTAAEDPALIFPGLGTEGCARHRREWVLRWRDAAGVPQSGDADFIAGHSYAAIARIARRTTGGAVTPTDVTDLRARGLQLSPASLVPDVLGTTGERYRQGLDRPALSLRDAINALLRGEMPSTADRAVDLHPAVDSIGRAFLFDGLGGMIAIWDSNRAGGLEQVYASRLDIAGGAPDFSAPIALTSGATRHNAPHAALVPNGDLLVTYQSNLGGNVFFKRAPFNGLAAAVEQPVAVSGVESRPMVVVSGDVAVFMFLMSPPDRWALRRFRHTDNIWLDAAPQPVPVSPVVQAPPHLALDGAGDVWIAFRDGSNRVQVIRFQPVTSTFGLQATFDVPAGIDETPFLVRGGDGFMVLVWRHPTGIFYSAQLADGTFPAAALVPGTAANDRQPTAVVDPSGGVWLYFVRGAPTDIVFTRRDPVTGGWGAIRAATVSPGNDSAPHALVGPSRETWLFWASDRDGNSNLYWKRIYTVI